MARRSADSTPKRSRTSIRDQLQLSFQSATAKESFLSRIEHMKRRLFPKKAVDNVQFLTAMPDRLEGSGGDAMEEAQCTRTVSVPMSDSSGLCKLYFETKEYVYTKYKFQLCKNYISVFCDGVPHDEKSGIVKIII